MVYANRSSGTTAILLALTALSGCGSDNGSGDLGGGPNPAVLSAGRSEPSGQGQSGTAGQDLATPLRIVVRRGDVPEAGAVVTWNSSSTGALLNPSVDTTGSDGISTSVWRLGSNAGTQSAEAAVAGGAEGSPVQFTATAAGPGGAPAPVEIQLRSDAAGDRFDPTSVTIAAGTTVTWNWASGFHNVTPTGTPAFTGSGNPVSAPHTFSQTFDTPGTYLYFCVVHGTPTAGMRGTIVVQ
jgi:plastocyanin